MSDAVRPARSDEFEEIARLIHEAFANYSKRLDAERAPRKRSSKDWVAEAIAQGSVFVFEPDAHMVGVAVLSPMDDAVYIDQIAIDPKYQKQGFGTRLLNAVEGQAKAMGRDTIVLHTAQPMTELVAFYSRAGYRVTHVAPRPTDPDGIDRVYFRKILT